MGFSCLLSAGRQGLEGLEGLMLTVKVFLLLLVVSADVSLQLLSVLLL